MKIKKFINDLKVRHYDHMMTYCMERWEEARLNYDERDKRCMCWVKRYDKYEAKLHKIKIV